MKRTLFIVALLFNVILIESQTTPEPTKIITAYKTNSKINIDGILNEPNWKSTDVASNFWSFYPSDSIKSKRNSNIRILYDNSFLYISAEFLNKKNKATVQTLNRDQFGDFWVSDGFAIAIDPNNKGQTGYYFAVNAKGAELDGTMIQTSYFPTVDLNWNNKWYSKVRNSENSSVYELAIPFSILNFNPSNTKWGINFVRTDIEDGNLHDSWNQVDKSRWGIDLGYLGHLQFDTIPEVRKGKITLIPSIAGNYLNNTLSKQSDYEFRSGIDAKIKVNASASIDLTLNPDYSHVEVNRQYIDFYRFEYYLPENRLFFIENSDLYNNLGFDLFKPIYTRRIGINNWQNIPIIGGGKANVNTNSGLRISALNIQTKEFNNLSSQNFSVASIQQNIFNKSFITAMFTNKEYAGSNNYNRSFGFEYETFSNNNKWNSKMGYYQSITPHEKDNNQYYNGSLNYNSNKIRINNSVNIAEKDYNNELGFMPRMYTYNPSTDSIIRKGVTEVSNSIQYWFYPKQKKNLVYYFPFIYSKSYLNDAGKMEELNLSTGMEFNFRNGMYLVSKYTYQDLSLKIPVFVIPTNENIPSGDYKTHNLFLYFGTNKTKQMQFSFDTEYGGFYNGDKLFFHLNNSHRIGSTAKLNIDYTNVRLNFPEKYGDANYHLLGFKSEVFFTKDLIWTNLIQYNTQINNLNLNTKLQWRYSPMSDFYVVINNNYWPQNIVTKQTNITFKITYWLAAQ